MKSIVPEVKYLLTVSGAYGVVLRCRHKVHVRFLFLSVKVLVATGTVFVTEYLGKQKRDLIFYLKNLMKIINMYLEAIEHEHLMYSQSVGIHMYF